MQNNLTDRFLVRLNKVQLRFTWATFCPLPI